MPSLILWEGQKGSVSDVARPLPSETLIGFYWDLRGGRPSQLQYRVVCRPGRVTTQQLGDCDYPRESCNIAYNTPTMLTNMNTSINDTMIVPHPLSVSTKIPSQDEAAMRRS